MAEQNTAKKKKGGLIRYFKDCRAELKKVTWPTKDQLIHNTGVIITFIIIVTIILSLLDFGFARLFQFLTNLL